LLASPIGGEITSNQAPDVAGEMKVLFESSYRKLLLMAQRILGDTDSAEDVIQDAFLLAWRGWLSFRGDSSRQTWVYGIAVNCALNRLRSNRRYGAVVSLDESRTLVAPSRDPSSEVVLDLDNAIKALPHRTRAVFVLRDVEGFSTEEVASRLGISAGTVKSQLFSARRALARTLGPELPQPGEKR